MQTEGRFKRGIREILLKKRDAIKLIEKTTKETAIRKRLFALTDFKKAKNILFYASFRSEVDTIQCIRDALKIKKMVALPCVDSEKKELRLYWIKNLSELKLGYMGIQEPKNVKSRELFLQDIDIVILPGAGFDTDGTRLGYGHGFYDKLLLKPRKPATTVALAFEEQIVPRVPKNSHDVKIDKIITEKRTIDCKKVERRKKMNNPAASCGVSKSKQVESPDVIDPQIVVKAVIPASSKPESSSFKKDSGFPLNRLRE